MNITESKFYSKTGGAADSIYKDFIFTYKSEVEGVTTSKWMMRNIIDKTKKLQSRSNSSYIESTLSFEEGFVYLEPTDQVFEILNKYFNSYKDLNTKKAGLVILYTNGFLSQYLDRLSIGNHIVTDDGVPVIDVLTTEMDSVSEDLGNQLEDLYTKEPLIRKANINIKDIYLNTRLSLAFSKLRKSLQKSGLSNEKLDEEYERLTGEINNVRNNYLDSKNHRTRMSAKYIIEKYNIMRYKTYSNSSGSSVKFRATLRGLISNDKYYLLHSQYAGICGIN